MKCLCVITGRNVFNMGPGNASPSGVAQRHPKVGPPALGKGTPVPCVLAVCVVTIPSAPATALLRSERQVQCLWLPVFILFLPRGQLCWDHHFLFRLRESLGLSSPRCRGPCLSTRPVSGRLSSLLTQLGPGRTEASLACSSPGGRRMLL